MVTLINGAASLKTGGSTVLPVASLRGPSASSTLMYERGGTHRPTAADEWGAGLFWGDYMAGVSRGGWVIICPNWRHAIVPESSYRGRVELADPNLRIGELFRYDADPLRFRMGGWLSLRNNRVLVEAGPWIYAIVFDEQGRPLESSFAFPTGTGPEDAHYYPVSYMGIYDHCIMSTTTVVCRRQQAAKLRFPQPDDRC
nr:hypothetical protein CFP56_31027 [Quercus suber]